MLTLRVGYGNGKTAEPWRFVCTAIMPAVAEVRAGAGSGGAVIGNTATSAGFLLAIFASVALALGAVGIYGVVAYSVLRRSREIGVRMALGARRSAVLRMVLGEGARLAGIGLAVGLASAFASSRLLASMLYGVKPNDPAVLVGVPIVLGVTALAATFIPARRASRVDPLIAMRET